MLMPRDTHISNWPEPTRFDVNDSGTWPAEGQRVLLGPGGSNHYVAVFERQAWVEEFKGEGDPAETGDLWWPLPPTNGPVVGKAIPCPSAPGSD